MSAQISALKVPETGNDFLPSRNRKKGNRLRRRKFLVLQRVA